MVQIRTDFTGKACKALRGAEKDSMCDWQESRWVNSIWLT